MLELEKTYLAKYLPENLENCEKKEVIDIYIPKSSAHPKLRIRKNGEKLEITKKEPIGEDKSAQLEQTIKLEPKEFEALAQLDGKKVHKILYLYPYNGIIGEIDVFQGDLKGLVVIDFEFETEEQKKSFAKPDFCLEEVTQENFIAGGMLCGKKYEDIENDLKRYNYTKMVR